MIYITEDDADIRELECYALTSAGYSTEGCTCAAELYNACENELPELILLDIMMPGEDGMSVLRRLRAATATAKIPVIMVTARGTELDKVKGLDTGADDYIQKPFGVMELVSRVKAVLRRVKGEDAGEVFECGGIVLDDGRHKVAAGDCEIELTYKEYELLKFMLRNCDIVLTRDKLLSSVWGFDYEGETRTVDMHIKTLRQKLGEYGQRIKTIRNVGYKIE